MTDIRERFRVFDHLRFPDEWREIEQRPAGTSVAESRHTPSPARRVLIAGVALALAVASLLFLAEAFHHTKIAPGVTPSLTFPPCTWRVVSSPNLLASSRDNLLRSVTADSPNDAWAVGQSSQRQEGGASRSTLLHWDGLSWKVASTQVGNVYGISADTPTDVWALSGRGSGAMRFDGSVWHSTTFADPGTKFVNLFAIEAVSPSDVWAVGGTADGRAGGVPLIEHWDGSSWSIIPVQGVPRNAAGIPQAGLYAVSVAPDGTVWAVGQDTSAAAGPGQQPLVVRGGTGGFTVVPSPGPSTSGPAVSWLFGVSASNNSVRAVGSYSSSEGTGGGTDRPFALAEDGGTWHQDPLPKLGGSSRLEAVATRGDQALAAGSEGVSRGERAIVLASSSSGWKKSAVPAPPGSSLAGISVSPDGSAWAVGSRRGADGAQRTLTMRSHNVPLTF